MTTTRNEREANRLLLAMAMRERRRARPFEWYTPSAPTPAKPWANQLGFHQAPHTMRFLVPGNGWGKTTAAAAECMAWGMHTNQWQRTPAWPIITIWFVKQRDQFDLQRVALQECVFGELPFKDDRFLFPDGGFMLMAWADDSSAWKKYQGVPADLIVFDEQQPWSLVKEMMFRRRAKRQTRYIFTMTDTEGDSWVDPRFYQPWIKYHAERGMTVEQALRAQQHPDIWFWDRGGVEDNPAASESDAKWYDSIPVTSEGERRTRRRGGFFTQAAGGVFDGAGLEWMKQQAAKATPIATVRGLHAVPHSLATSTPEQLRECWFEPTNLPMPTGKLTVWEEPQKGRRYAAGADFSYGVGRNEDYVVILDATNRHHPSEPMPQVAELSGNLFGPNFHRYLYALLRWYNNAYLVGERQVGLFTLARLWTDYGYNWLYRHRSEGKANVIEAGNADLGWHRKDDDLVMTTNRQHVLARRVIYRSPTILNQMARLHFARKSEAAGNDDARLLLKLRNPDPPEESPDGVMAAGYALFAAIQLEQAPPTENKYPAGTVGEMMGLTPQIPDQNRGTGWISTRVRPH